MFDLSWSNVSTASHFRAGSAFTLNEPSTRNFRAGLGSTLATASHRPIKTLYDASTIRLQQCRIHSQSRLLRLQPCRTHSQSHYNALQPHLPSRSIIYSLIIRLRYKALQPIYSLVTTLYNRSAVPLHRSTPLYDALRHVYSLLGTLHSTSTVSTTCSTTRVQFHCNVLQLVCSSIQHVYSSITLSTVSLERSTTRLESHRNALQPVYSFIRTLCKPSTVSLQLSTTRLQSH